MQYTDDRQPPAPGAGCLEEHRSYWMSAPEYVHYIAQETALDRMFALLPLNNDPVDVFTKVSLLNDMYNTNIFRTYDVAVHITGLGVDGMLGSGDPVLVDSMKTVDVGGRRLNLYSFSAKYCNRHNPAGFPIYDSYIDTLLCHYRKADGFSEFRRQDLKEYPVYRGILDDFIRYYGLDGYCYNDVTRLLWMLGREHFNKFA